MTAVAPASNTQLDDTRVLVDSVALGEVKVHTESIFHFSSGIHGFEAHHEFALIPAARESLFWLQSLSAEDVVFLLIDPFVAVPGFELDLGATERTSLELDNPMDVLVLAIVTLPVDNIGSPTANVRGPVVLNTRKRTAAQVMSAVPGHEVRTPVDLHVLAARTE